MFWNNNNNNNNNAKSPTTSPSPGQRRTSANLSSSTFIAPTIRGSIRAPSSSQQQYTRQEHLDSYLNDETLKRSTRKVSDGAFYLLNLTYCPLFDIYLHFVVYLSIALYLSAVHQIYEQNV
jgi:hypothetical protein